MKDYSAMSDFEINKLVGELTGEATSTESVLCLVMHNASGRKFDPCNNPADAWPIILENKINIDHRSGFKNPMAKSCTDNSLYATHHNVLRAAITVYLMMKDAEKGHG